MSWTMRTCKSLRAAQIFYRASHLRKFIVITSILNSNYSTLVSEGCLPQPATGTVPLVALEHFLGSYWSINSKRSAAGFLEARLLKPKTHQMKLELISQVSDVRLSPILRHSGATEIRHWPVQARNGGVVVTVAPLRLRLSLVIVISDSNETVATIMQLTLVSGITFTNRSNIGTVRGFI